MHPMPRAIATRGFTLVEMVLVIVIASVLAAMISSFVTLPIRGAVDVARRAELTDLADNALRRMERDIRRALPNSVRVMTVGASTFIDLIAQNSGACASWRLDSLTPIGPDASFVGWETSFTLDL